jgi:hypothetical protein
MLIHARAGIQYVLCHGSLLTMSSISARPEEIVSERAQVFGAFRALGRELGGSYLSSPPLALKKESEWHTLLGGVGWDGMWETLFVIRSHRTLIQNGREWREGGANLELRPHGYEDVVTYEICRHTTRLSRSEGGTLDTGRKGGEGI